jgi:hypothetical protein
MQFEADRFDPTGEPVMPGAILTGPRQSPFVARGGARGAGGGLAEFS